MTLSAPAPGRSATSTGRSSTSKIRPNSASDVDTCCPIPCSPLTGPTSRLTMLANATTVPIEASEPPCARNL